MQDVFSGRLVAFFLGGTMTSNPINLGVFFNTEKLHAFMSGEDILITHEGCMLIWCHLSVSLNRFEINLKGFNGAT